MPNVTPDNAGTSAGGTSLTSKTITSFAIGAGTDRLLLVGVSQWAATDQTPSGNFNTTETLTVHDAHTAANFGGTSRASLLRRIAPSNATASIVINWGGTVDELVVGADSWTNAHQTTPLGTVAKAAAVSGTASTGAISSASGDVVHDVLYMSVVGASPRAVGNNTLRWANVAASSTTEGDGQYAASAGSPITLTYTNPDTQPWAIIGFAIQQSASASTPVYRSQARPFPFTPGSPVSPR